MHVKISREWGGGEGSWIASCAAHTLAESVIQMDPKPDPIEPVKRSPKPEARYNLALSWGTSETCTAGPL